MSFALQADSLLSEPSGNPLPQMVKKPPVMQKVPQVRSLGAEDLPEDGMQAPPGS